MQLSSYLLALLIAVSLAISDSESECRSSGEEVGLITEHESDAPGPRCNSDIARKRLARWPVHRILEELCARNISVPSSLNHGGALRSPSDQ